MRKLILSAAIASAFSGCVSFPENYQDDVGVPDIVDQYQDAWSHEVPLRYVQSASGASVNRYFTLPDEVANKKVRIDLNHGVDVTVGDLIYALRAQGYKVISRLGDSERAELLLRSFSGTLGQFVEDLSQIQNIAYEYRNGVLFILEANRYSVTLPQHEELLLQVAASLIEMGATDVRTDLLAGMVHFAAKPDISDYVTEYLDRIAQNSAMIRLQIAVVTVGLNRNIDLGLDWAHIMAQSGTKEMRPSISGGVFGNNRRTGSEGPSGESGRQPSRGVNVIGQGLSFLGGSGFTYNFGSDSFSLSAAIKALSTYGSARTEQNVVLGTVSGMPVRISSGNDIPYVKSIGSTTAAGGSTSGSSQTEVVRSGLELEITPNFDSSDGSVVTTVKVKMSSLVGFRELSAGINLGTLSQPEMQNLEFENVGRLQAGETIVIGGITYDQMSDNYNSMPGAERLPIGSKAQQVNKNAIYIVIRPTVVIFSREADRLSEKMKQEQRDGVTPLATPQRIDAQVEPAPAPTKKRQKQVDIPAVENKSVPDVSNKKEQSPNKNSTLYLEIAANPESMQLLEPTVSAPMVSAPIERVEYIDLRANANTNWTDGDQKYVDQHAQDLFDERIEKAEKAGAQAEQASIEVRTEDILTQRQIRRQKSASQPSSSKAHGSGVYQERLIGLQNATSATPEAYIHPLPAPYID